MASRIDFHFNVPNRVLYACRVVRKALANDMTVAVWTRDERKLDFFSRQLWSFDPTGFIRMWPLTMSLPPKHRWSITPMKGFCPRATCFCF